MGRAGDAMVWLCIGTSLLAGGATRAADWPQWRGAQRNGISTERLPLDRSKPQAGPPVAWRAAVGKGHSAVSVAGGRAYTLGWDGQQDTVWCFDAADGKLIWKQSYASGDIKQWPGPRATPTVHDGRVFTLGLHGHLACWDARQGRQIWSVRLAESYNPDVDYGMAWSPLVCGDLLILAAGQRGLAIRTADGSYAWGTTRIEAALIAVEGGRVRLRKTSGQEIEVPLSRLSREDRLWAERRASEATPR